MSVWRREIGALRVALGLLTRLPVGLRNLPAPALRGRSLHYYPLAGLVIGWLIWLASLLTGRADLLLSSALVVAAWVALTGALHLDGLADCADAWVGGMGDRQRTLTIMKDPASGPVAVVVLVLVLLLKVASLHTLLSEALPGWWLSPLAARAVLPFAFLTLPYVRAGGMGESLAGSASRPCLGLASALALLAVALILPAVHAALWLAVAVAVFCLWRVAMLKRLGGFTGDGAGALVELLELALLLGSALLLGGRP